MFHQRMTFDFFNSRPISLNICGNYLLHFLTWFPMIGIDFDILLSWQERWTCWPSLTYSRGLFGHISFVQRSRFLVFATPLGHRSEPPSARSALGGSRRCTSIYIYIYIYIYESGLVLKLCTAEFSTKLTDFWYTRSLAKYPQTFFGGSF